MDAARFRAGLRVLAVDEDRVNLVVLKRVLKVCDYNNVTIVADVSTTLDMLRERKDGDDQFDLVISDFFIPNNGINGLKFLELVAVEMDIPVIGISLAQTHPTTIFMCMAIF
ncbi:hypothetical protein BDA96_10G271100 [Sorghum bicolor]|uniref:Response regulatory domain-containing protein n=1 Tax=Sorghum bicolor TaxID=4558 RepID=A0A921Q785_SORBI|nr:hypothetical protein BDA96_10G271100 [Sorghum bicolor]